MPVTCVVWQKVRLLETQKSVTDTLLIVRDLLERVSAAGVDPAAVAHSLPSSYAEVNICALSMLSPVCRHPYPPPSTHTHPALASTPLLVTTIHLMHT